MKYFHFLNEKLHLPKFFLGKQPKDMLYKIKAAKKERRTRKTRDSTQKRVCKRNSQNDVAGTPRMTATSGIAFINYKTTPHFKVFTLI